MGLIIHCLFLFLNSTFSDIFDENHFINALQGDIHIVRELPKELASLPRARKHFTSWASASYYEEVSHLFKDYKVSNWVLHALKNDHISIAHIMLVLRVLLVILVWCY